MPSLTIARPYAKAIFSYAKESSHNESAKNIGHLSQWSQILNTLVWLLQQEEVARFVNNPITDLTQQINLLILPFVNLSSDTSQAVENLLSLLIINKRLMLLPAIQEVFEALRADEEKTVEVLVRSFAKLSEEQEERLKQQLSQRLARKVTLKVSIDKALLGGAIIQAGDLVIDGSVRTQLKKLEHSMGLCMKS